MAAGDIPGLGPLLDILQHSGPTGAILAGAIVGVTLALILLAHFKGLWGTLSTEARQAQFQLQCLALIADLRATEAALRKRLEDESLNRGRLQDEMEQDRVQLALLRGQRQRLIAMLRQMVAALPEPAARRPRLTVEAGR